jgi:hypothetical protein
MSPSVFQMKGIDVCEVHQSAFISALNRSLEAVLLVRVSLNSCRTSALTFNFGSGKFQKVITSTLRQSFDGTRPRACSPSESYESSTGTFL